MKFIILALVIQTVASWDPVDPEEALFTYTRCIEEFSKKASNPSVALMNWKSWKLEPANELATKCYVKCALVRLGLYDPVANAFKPERIDPQWEKYRKYDFVDENKVQAYKNALQSVAQPASDKCEDIFSAYQAVHSKHVDTSRKLFHGYPENTAVIYKDLGRNIRQRKQSYFVFCENKYYLEGANERNKLCDIRAYKVFEKDETYKQLLICIFRGLRYLTNENKINETEIVRDFVQVGKDESKIQQLVKKCGTGAPANDDKSLVLHYYKCLLADPLKEDFKEAFNYRELRSEDYAYKLRPNTPPYSKAVVDARMAEIDDFQCPKSS
ncbi:37 kDa salivary gland allergen Aed a 2-like [Sabethes cyaneus]|uniref:37 kDa salivary gland allergen Aed a 2-like n=1 Tax=Sabethes cyaneus TaxID=53552 RepID=UPI00237DD27C|nr:37 kDa salivary gland allergen Aed a 2-like [Sabethes cyaneus]